MKESLSEVLSFTAVIQVNKALCCVNEIDDELDFQITNFLAWKKTNFFTFIEITLTIRILKIYLNSQVLLFVILLLPFNGLFIVNCQRVIAVLQNTYYFCLMFILQYSCGNNDDTHVYTKAACKIDLIMFFIVNSLKFVNLSISWY